MVSQSEPVEPRTIARCTVRQEEKKVHNGRQSQGTTNEAEGRMAQSAATGFPI